jgi:hypothetical protein
MAIMKMNDLPDLAGCPLFLRSEEPLVIRELRRPVKLPIFTRFGLREEQMVNPQVPEAVYRRVPRSVYWWYRVR